MITKWNNATPLDAAMTPPFHIEDHRRGASEFYRCASP
jgi:hypothetical protein